MIGNLGIVDGIPDDDIGSESYLELHEIRTVHQVLICDFKSPQKYKQITSYRERDVMSLCVTPRRGGVRWLLVFP